MKLTPIASQSTHTSVSGSSDLGEREKEGERERGEREGEREGEKEGEREGKRE